MSTITTFKYGYVVGRFVSSLGDSDDVDRLPDHIGASVAVTFTRIQGQYVQSLGKTEKGMNGVMVSHQPVKASVMSDGTLTGDVDASGKALPNATSGLWLVTGQYRVDLGGFFPSLTIDVRPEHTEANPLDLASAVGYVPAPNEVVHTLSLPSGGEPGQVYGWDGVGVGWYTPQPGPQGPKGDTGATGSPGAVANASSYILTGTGRPDVPSSTGGIIKGSEPVGAEYRSTDGASVGAYKWTKRPDGSWVVVDGDTGWRTLLAWDATGQVITGNAAALEGAGPRTDSPGSLRVRRVNERVELRLSGFLVSATTITITMPSGFTATPSPGGQYPSQSILVVNAGGGRTPVTAIVGTPKIYISATTVGFTAQNSYSTTIEYSTDIAWPTILPSA